jgi:ribosomal protein L37AE/L43A
MNRKFCESCKGYSYSAATYGKWTCPYCRNDLTHAELLIPDLSYNASTKVRPTRSNEPIPFRRKING